MSLSMSVFSLVRVYVDLFVSSNTREGLHGSLCLVQYSWGFTWIFLSRPVLVRVCMDLFVSSSTREGLRGSLSLVRCSWWFTRISFHRVILVMTRVDICPSCITRDGSRGYLSLVQYSWWFTWISVPRTNTRDVSRGSLSLVQCSWWLTWISVPRAILVMVHVDLFLSCNASLTTTNFERLAGQLPQAATENSIYPVKKSYVPFDRIIHTLFLNGLRCWFL